MDCRYQTIYMSNCSQIVAKFKKNYKSSDIADEGAMPVQAPRMAAPGTPAPAPVGGGGREQQPVLQGAAEERPGGAAVNSRCQEGGGG